MLQYILGFIFGIIFCMGSIWLYLYVTFKKQKKKEEEKLTESIEGLDEKIRQIVLKNINQYQKLDSFGFENSKQKLQDISKRMMNEIAKKYYPNSKYPEYEIEVYQFLKLNSIMTNYMLELLNNNKIVRPLKKVKVSDLLKIKNNGPVVLDGISKGTMVAGLLMTGPVVYLAKRAGFKIGKRIVLESTYRIGGKYLIEKFARELNKLYSGHYNEKKDFRN